MSDRNPQAMAYGLGAMDLYGDLYDIEKVVLRIIQPPLGNDQEAVVTPEELEAFREEIRASTTKSWAMLNSKMMLELNPSKDNCQFCPAAMHCEAKKRHVMNVVTANFDDLGEPMHLEIPEAVSKDTVKALLPYADEAKKFLSKVQAEALELAKRGEKIEGYKLVSGRRSYFWSDEKKATDFLSLYLDEEELFERKMVSVAQARKLVGKEPGFDDLVAAKEGSLTLAPESDKRKEVKAVTFNNLGD